MSDQVEPFIETYLGIAFRSMNPRPEDVNIGDIAHALSHQCRFSGHTKVFYSVAEHCVRVARLVMRTGSNHVRWALLHDASEAYLVDLPTPLKLDPRIGVPYRDAERALMNVICDVFGLQREQPEIVSWADQVLLATEVRDLMPGCKEHWRNLRKPLSEPIYPWSPEMAKFEFIEMYLGYR